MSDVSAPSTELAPNGGAPWHASGAHPVPPTAGSYVPVDHSTLLSAANPGAISPVLVLPQVGQPDQLGSYPDALADPR